MAKYEYMLQQAQRQVWCNPLMDSQFVLEPQRISVGYGALNTVFTLDRQIPVPMTNQLYHVFQVGQLTPAQLNLIERNPSWTAEKWFTFTEAMNQLKLYVNIYNADGVNIPRFTSYFMFTREKCLLFAITRDPRIVMNSDDDKIYFRFYTNAFFSSRVGVSRGAKIETKGYIPNNTTDILSAQADFRRAQAKPGLTEAFVNGFLVNDINPGTARPGDRIEWVQDGSVKRMVEWNITDLTPFTSTLDKKFKHLLHYANPEPHQIDYQDDLDVYMRSPIQETRGFKGRYYPKNMRSAMRNVTHRDYSVMGSIVTFVTNGLIRDMGKDAPNYQDMKLMLKIREGGYQRPLIQDAGRIFELYKLPDQNILAAMSGIISAPPVWHAANLEANDYPKVMGTLLKDLTILDVEGCYGYNSMSRILADTPQKTHPIGVFNVANPPELLQKDSTFYEFNENGAMLGWHYHQNDDDYEARSRDTRMVEGIVGRGTERPAVQFGQTSLRVPETSQYRLYYRRVLTGQPQAKWQDVTGDSRSSVTNGILHWNDTVTNYELMLRSNENFLAYDTRIQMSQGMLRFTLSEVLNKGTQYYQTYPMEVPMGQLQIWLNGYNLVRDVDYILDFPNVYINSYPFLNQPAATAMQNIHVRFTGFCTKEMQLDDDQQIGFVEHGALSNNRHYNLRDDKVLHISVGGRTMHRGDMKFFEDRPGWDIQNPMNGRPYQVAEIVPPLRDYVKTPWPDLRKKSQAIDKVVSDYMTEYMPPLTEWRNSSAVSRWPLFSAFFSHILYRLSTGGFFLVTDAEWTDQEVIAMCKPYETLFATDPLSEPEKLPSKFVVIRPHPYNNTVNLTRTQYRFLMQVVKLYGRDKIGINNFVTFTP